MLPEGNRLTERDDFSSAVRRGRRSGGRRLVLHLATAAEPQATPAARVGFVVGKAVGNAVTRNRVRRRLRHLMIGRLPLLPAGSLLVVRVLPEAAMASSETLAVELDRGLGRLTGQPVLEEVSR